VIHARPSGTDPRAGGAVPPGADGRISADLVGLDRRRTVTGMASPPPPARSAEERKRDVLERLQHDIDLWIATASPDGDAHLVPLSFVWHDEHVVMATRVDSVTVANLRERPRARLALGHTRDVVLVEGDTQVIDTADLDAATRRAFAEHTGWDAANEHGYVFLSLAPDRVRAWREENELAGRTLMVGGSWRA
jgi:general stress protein 26